jgi:protein O-mannosyl-transferase
MLVVFNHERMSQHSFYYFGVMRRILTHLFLVAVVGLLAYSNTFHIPFHFDDYANISENHLIQNFHDFVLSGKGYEFNPRRFIGYVTFALNYKLGGLNVVGYHLVNFAVHIATAFLVYFLVTLSFETPVMRLPAGEAVFFSGSLWEAPSLIALFSALLFVSHPVQTQAVTYIVQRFTSLTAMFYLLSVIMYVKGRLNSLSAKDTTQRGDKNTGNSWSYTLNPILFYVLSVVFAILAMKTKEISFTLPFVIVLYEFTFFRSSMKKKLLFLLPVLLTLVIVPISVIGVNKPLGDILSDLSERTRVENSLPRWDYLMTEMRVITTYIRLLFLPVNQNLDYDYPVYHSFLAPPVFLSFAFLFAVFGTALYLLYRSRRSIPNFGSAEQSEGGIPLSPLPLASYYRLAAFGIFWFFIALSVESSFIPISDVMFEHRIYLPSVGAFIAITSVVFAIAVKLRNKWPMAERAVVSALIVIVVILSAATYARNMVWQDEAGLWGDVIRKSPGNARAYNNLGYFYLGKGMPDRAIECFRTALGLQPRYANAHTNLGVAYNDKGWTYEAVEQFRTALQLYSSAQDRAEAHHDLGLAYVQMGLLDDATSELEAAVKLDPNNPEIYSDLGVVYKKKGLIDRAIECYKRALSLKPDYAPAHYNLGIIYREQGLREKSEEHLDKAHLLDPGKF